jgi:hypothetical protein
MASWALFFSFFNILTKISFIWLRINARIHHNRNFTNLTCLRLNFTHTVSCRTYHFQHLLLKCYKNWFLHLLLTSW